MQTIKMSTIVQCALENISKDSFFNIIILFFKVQVIFPHSTISNTEKYFNKYNEFLPERWLKSCPYKNDNYNISKQHHPFASLPFGYGKRMCLGRRFADLEIQTIIAKVK